MSTVSTETPPTAEATPVPRSAIASPVRAWGAYAVGMLLLVLLLVVVQGKDYWLNIITLAFLFAAAASAWKISGGFGGQLSFGHGVFFAIGAYSVAILYGQHGISPWLCLLIAIPVAMAVAAVTSAPIFRLRGPFFSMATLALNQVALVLAVYFASFTGGSQGIALPFKPSTANLTFVNRINYGIVSLVLLAIIVAVALWVSRSRLGYALRAVREDDQSAAAAGFGIFRTKMTGMLLSGALTALAGGLYAVYIHYVDPESVLSLGDVGVRFVLIALLGGIGTVSGPVVGALVLIPIIYQLQGLLAGARPGVNLAVVGLLIVLIPLAFRSGIVGSVAKAWHALQRRRAR
jgi:branched-chain amino acid transport system permease protein